MKSYSSLGSISKIFNVLAWTNLVSGLIFTVAVSWTVDSQNALLPFITFIGGVILSVLLYLIFMASSQFILLIIGLADNVEDLKNNVSVISKK